MQRAPDVHGRDLRNVGAVLVHDEELQRRIREPLWWNEPVAIAGEGYLATGNRRGTKVQDSVAQGIEARPRRHRIRLVEVARPGVGCEFAEGELLNLSGTQIDPKDVG